MTERERALAIHTADVMLGIKHNPTTNALRLVVIDCIEEFCRLQKINPERSK